MMNLIVIMTPTEPFHLFKQAQMELDEKFPKLFKLHIYTTKELDDDEEIYSSCVKESEMADFIFIKIHGSLSFWKTFLPYFNEFKNKKRIFLQTTIQEEIDETFPLCGIMPEDFKSIRRKHI